MNLCQAPKAVCPTIWMGCLGNSRLSSIRLSLLKVVEGASTLCIPVWANDPHQVAHMPAMGKLQGAAMVQTPAVKPPGMNMPSSMAPESRKQTPEQTPNI